MKDCRSVHEVLSSIALDESGPVEVEGILVARETSSLRGPEYWLLNYPKGDGDPRFCLLLEFGYGSIRPNHTALARWIDKRVRVQGLSRSARSLSNPSDIWDQASFSPHIEVYSIQRLTAAQRRKGAQNAVQPDDSASGGRAG